MPTLEINIEWNQEDEKGRCNLCKMEVVKVNKQYLFVGYEPIFTNVKLCNPCYEKITTICNDATYK